MPSTEGAGAGAGGGSSEAREVREPRSVKPLTAQCPLSPHAGQALGTADLQKGPGTNPGLAGPPPTAPSRPQALRPSQALTTGSVRLQVPWPPLLLAHSQPGRSTEGALPTAPALGAGPQIFPLRPALPRGLTSAPRSRPSAPAPLRASPPLRTSLTGSRTQGPGRNVTEPLFARISRLKSTEWKPPGHKRSKIIL